ncbi:MAG: ABC transporter substrate-binding protein [Lachnospiraceae bacterium]|nr:ABC transporter substrate-binding protein [Lachnospiraceae bacterium]
MIRKSLLITITVGMILLSGCSSKLQEPAVSAQAVVSSQDEKLHDGEYSIELSLEGGSGKASIASPAKIIVKNGEMTVEIIWSSSNYDYMILDGTKYTAEIKDEKSCFYIPVKASDEYLDIKADTTAMSKPHEIDYKLIFSWDTFKDAYGGVVSFDVPDNDGMTRNENLWSHTSISSELNDPDRMDMDRATEFDVWYYDGGYRELRISDGTRILVVPEGGEVPGDLDADVKVLNDPVNDIYMVSTSGMDYFDKTDSLDRLKFTSLEAGDWESENVNAKMFSGDIRYAGKYSAPDYEMLKADGCRLVIENTMILHSPEVSEKLEELGFPVIIDMSSYEADPLGRAEWVRFYGALLGCEDKADEAYEKQKTFAEQVISEVESSYSDTKKNALIFYFTDNGMVNVKNSSDYLATMIEMCGADYIYENSEGKNPGSASATISSEDFYSLALNADILIYNTTIAGSVDSKEDLLADYSLLSGFKAYQNDGIYRMNSNVFQNPMSAGEIMEEMYEIISTGEDDQGNFFDRLR